MKKLLDIIAKLRSPDGCPWDREQTLESLKSPLVEETYEVIDAIDSGEEAAHCEELGDLLLHVVMQAQIRSEMGGFKFDDVVEGICEKLVRRHPHVFGDVEAGNSDEVLKRWEAIKAEEKGKTRESILDGIPRQLPALQRAQRVQVRAARVGFDWDQIEEVVAKLDEEVEEAKEAIADGGEKEIEHELGDVLFSVVNLCRFIGLDSEQAMDKVVKRFAQRFAGVEKKAAAAGKKLSDCTLVEMEAWWQASK